MQTMIFRTQKLSPEDNEDLHTYIASLPDLPLLTPEQEASADADTLVERNIRLSIMVACKYAGRGVPVVDLVQEGNMGLMRAAAGFDPSRGRFSTYAMRAIRDAVLRAIHNQGNTIRKPVWAQDGSKREDIPQQARALAHKRVVVSMGDAGFDGNQAGERTNNIYGDGKLPIETMLFSPADTEADALERVAAVERRDVVLGLLSVLDERERDVICLHVLDGRTLRQVAEDRGFSYQTAHNILTIAKAKMIRAYFGDVSGRPVSIARLKSAARELRPDTPPCSCGCGRPSVIKGMARTCYDASRYAQGKGDA